MEKTNLFDKAQSRLIKKFQYLFHIEISEVESEAWLVLADLQSQGRDPKADFNSVLWSRLKNIYRRSAMWANPVLADSVEALIVNRQDSGVDKEGLIASLPKCSKAAKNIELFTGCRSTKEVAEKNNWSLASAKRYVAAAIAEAECGYTDDLFEPKHEADWRPARVFKSCKLTDLAVDLHFNEGEDDEDEAYFENREAA